MTQAAAAASQSGIKYLVGERLKYRWRCGLAGCVDWGVRASSSVSAGCELVVTRPAAQSPLLSPAREYYRQHCETVDTVNTDQAHLGQYSEQHQDQTVKDISCL